jgi:nucleoside-diphosphate-sugar epimerase
MASKGDLRVVFGAAALGQSIMRLLVARGRPVRMVSRNPALQVPGGVEVVRADVSDPAAAIKAAEGASVVYHTAAPDYTRWAELYPPLQRGVMAAAEATGARLVSAESVYAYGPVAGPMTEDLPYVASTRKGRLRAEMSNMLLEAHAAGKLRAAIARAPDFYGPLATTTTIYGDRVFYPAIAGKKVSVMGKLDLPHTFIYIDDFARGMITLGDHEDAMGQVWHLPCAPTLTQRELLTLIFQAAGKTPRLGEAPGAVFKIAGLFVPIMRELSELLYQWERPFQFGHAKFERAFGAEVTPHERAVAATVAWFQAHPQTAAKPKKS